MNVLEIYMKNKGQEYREFDRERMGRILERLVKCIDFSLSAKTIQVLGTNGKGSTGRFLTQLLMQNGYKVLHFSSPHIFRFNERFYKNGKIIDDSELLKAHNFLQQYDFINKASYFEYATFLAFILAKDVDYLVLEAGVGGEWDSTSRLKRDMCLYSVIDMDHCEMLGDSIDKIATTKLNAMVSPSVIGIQRYQEVLDIAKSIAESRNVKLYFVDKVSNEVYSYLQKFNLASFLAPNLALALKAMEILGIKYNLNALGTLDLAGRFQRVAENVIVDVGHNQNAALAIKQNLKSKKVILVYNSYFQKNIKEILSILKGNIIRVEIIEISDNERIVSKDKLIEILCSLDIKYSDFKGIDKDYEYLVFGSFSVVEKFMDYLK